MHFVALFAAKKIETFRSKPDCIVEHGEHQLGAGAEMRKCRIETLQVTEDSLALKERIDHSHAMIVYLHAVKA